MVFVERPNEKEQLFNVGVMLRKKETKGDVGIEIEVEGKKLPKENDTPPPWVYHIDHSLRGEDNGEYVLAKPIDFDGVPAAIDTLWEAFANKKSVLDESNRTSVHIHLNVQSFHLNRLTSLMGLWFALEDILTEYSGDHRVGNLFCLRASDAHAIVSQIRDFIQSNMSSRLKDQLHYAALNAHSLAKYGSMEFRTFRGATRPEEIKAWVGILRRLYEFSAELPDPREICYMFSAQGATAFFNNVLGEYADVVRAGVKMDETDIRNAIFAGIRRAQDLCYCRDWSVFEGIDFKPDPFGRSAKEMLKKLQAQNPNVYEGEVYASEGEDYDDDDFEEEYPPPPVDAPSQVIQPTTAGGFSVQQMHQLMAQGNIPPGHTVAYDLETGNYNVVPISGPDF